MRGWFQPRDESQRDRSWGDWTYVAVLIALVLLALIVVGAL